VRASKTAINLIASFEGFSPKPYGPPKDIWTIGYGHTAGVNAHTPHITEAQGKALLLKDVNETYAPPVERAANRAGVTLNQNQFDALVSAVYNLGPGILEAGRTMGNALRSGNKLAIANAFLVYNMPGSIFEKGLTRRRQAERALFLRPVKPKKPTRKQKLQKFLDHRERQLKAEKNPAMRTALKARIAALKAQLKLIK
jgi:lysozyme